MSASRTVSAPARSCTALEARVVGVASGAIRRVVASLRVMMRVSFAGPDGGALRSCESGAKGRVRLRDRTSGRRRAREQRGEVVDRALVADRPGRRQVGLLPWMEAAQIPGSARPAEL